MRQALILVGYDANSGWLSSLSTTPAGGSATSLLDTIGYSGAGGAAGHATSANVAGGTYSFSSTYDADTRLSSLSLTNVSTSAVLFRSQRGYDAASNVTAVNTTLSAGTDNQAFCYDEQNRLVWAGASGTPSCGASLTAGSLSSASYTQTFAYDTLDRLTSGPLGSYTYGDTTHLHAVTSIGSGPTYTATYDAVGDMTCRAPDNTTTCAGTPTGAQLGYDNEGRLTTWQNVPSSPTTTDGFLYDGAGNRVEQLVTVNGSITTTTTYVAGGLEEIASNAVGTTLTKYFTGANGLPTAEQVGTNGPLSYLASDGQGTVSTALDGAGNVTSQQLYTPYGNARYSSGSSPTTLGYTGQRADSSTGLDYYNARYYDPVAGQFASADTVADGSNRYGYVAGNPTTNTDPSGHRCVTSDGGVCGGPGSSPPPLGCHITNTCTTNNPHPCGGTWSAKQCQEGDAAKNGDALGYKVGAKLVQSLLGVFNFIFDFRQLQSDWNSTDPAQVIEVVGDILALAGDALSVISGILSALSVAGLNVLGVQKWVDGVSAALSGFAALYKVFRAAEGFWVGFAEIAFMAGLDLLKLAVGEEEDLTLTIIFQTAAGALRRINPQWDEKFLQKAGTSLIQGIASGLNAAEEAIEDVPTGQYCTEHPEKCPA